MSLELVKLTREYKEHLFDMMDEWLAIESEDRVPDSVFFGLDTDSDIFVGAVNIRHYLNERLLYTGGHIGDGIRPSERRKGYAAKMIELALEECRKL